MIPVYKLKRDTSMRLKLIKDGPQIKAGPDVITVIDEHIIHSIMCDSSISLHTEHTEHMYVICLDKDNGIKAICRIADGTDTSVQTYIANILACPILTGCRNIILVHNHPSENDTPSTNDIALTKQVINACKTMQMSLVEHYIVASKTKGYSFIKNKPSLFA